MRIDCVFIRLDMFRYVNGSWYDKNLREHMSHDENMKSGTVYYENRYHCVSFRSHMFPYVHLCFDSQKHFSTYQNPGETDARQTVHAPRTDLRRRALVHWHTSSSPVRPLSSPVRPPSSTVRPLSSTVRPLSSPVRPLTMPIRSTRLTALLARFTA